MARYVTRSITLVPIPWSGDNQHLLADTVICDELGGVPTGLLDAVGSPIMRLPDPIGFDLSTRRSPPPDPERAA